MTRTLPSLAAAALLAAASFASVTAAEAGSGVRLNFGGPLGTFIAHPTPGYGGSDYSAHKKPKSPHYAKRVPSETPRTVSRDASRTKKPTRAVARIAPDDVKTPITADTATDTTTPATGTKSLAAGSLPVAETVTALLPDETVIAVEAPAPVASEPVKTDVKPATRTVEVGPQDCKKFIPAVGVTVTVGCSK